MRILVVGAGGVGTSFALIAARRGFFEHIVVADYDKTRAQAVVDRLKNNYQPITELRTAVIWTKGCSGFNADYSVEHLPTNPWIHQPFEAYDTLSPEKLLEKWKV